MRRINFKPEVIFLLFSAYVAILTLKIVRYITLLFNAASFVTDLCIEIVQWDDA